MPIIRNYTLADLEKVLKSANRPVIATGAGISTLSGIPDYSQMSGVMTEAGYLSARQMLSSGVVYSSLHNDFVEWFIETFYQKKEPNKIHHWITKMDSEVENLTVITQNVDGLQSASNLIEYHGNANLWYCEKCRKKISKDEAARDSYRCLKCEHVLQPDIVLYGQFVDSEKQAKAAKACLQSDCIIVIGTSLQVFPFCKMILDHWNQEIYWLDKDTPEAWFDHHEINMILSDLATFF